MRTDIGGLQDFVDSGALGGFGRLLGLKSFGGLVGLRWRGLGLRDVQGLQCLELGS